MTNKWYSAVLWGWLVLLASPAQAVLEIEITEGVEGALPIAVLPFAWGPAAGTPPESIDGIVEADLRRSGLFAPLSPAEFPQQANAAAQLNFALWRDAGVENIVLGSVTPRGQDEHTVQFQLFDVIRGQSLMSYGIPASNRTLRKVAHKISDLVYEKLIGVRGAFGTRIAYIGVRRQADGSQHYLLQVADSDGFNAQSVYESAKPLMSPAWSPDGRRLAYVSFENGRSEVFVQDLASGRRSKVSGQAGINSAPAWSPDGSRLAITLSESGNPEIYVKDLGSGKLTRLTNSRSIDTEPAWNPDGRSLIFTSDRSGKPQLYRISAAGGRATRVTFEGRYNAAADISPDGKQVAMVHNGGNGFRIAVMDLATGDFRVLTDGRLDESPSFAPNGSMIIYATQNRGRGELAAVSVDGGVHQRLSQRDEDVREPQWSPFPD